MNFLRKKSTLLSIIALLLFGTILIFYKSGQLPQFISWDEYHLAKLALSLDHTSYTPFSSFADGHATLYFYILLLSFKFLGVSHFALRLPIAIFGILNILIYYSILRLVFKKNLLLPIILSIALLTSHWYLNFVRFSFEIPFLLFLELVSCYFILNFHKEKKLYQLILCGIFAGLAFNSYQPGRIFFILPLLTLFIKREKVLTFFLFLIPFVITIYPLTSYLALHQESDIRINQQLFLKDQRLSIQAKASYLVENISKIALMFNLKGDLNGRHNYPGKPALNPYLGILFIIGLIVALSQIRSFYNQFFLIYIALALLPTIFTLPVENPNMLRTFTALPGIIYLIGVGFLYLKQKLFSGRKFVVIFLTVILVISCLYELRTYFYYQALISDSAFDVRCPLIEMVKYEPRQVPFKCRF